MSLFGYWKIRGIGQPIRLLLNFVGEDFEEKYYICGDAPEYSRDHWLKEKFSFGFDFPNVPYYIDGNVKLTQSTTILRYIGRKYKLDGSTEQENIRIDLVTDEAVDVRNALITWSYGPDPADRKADYLKYARPKVDQLEAFIGENKFFAGNNITFVDFLTYDLLDQLRILDPTIFSKNPKLKAFLDRFEALPAIRKYMSSNKFLARPIHSIMAFLE